MRVTQVLLTGCLVMALLYAYNMYLVITRTVAAQNAEKQTTTLADSVQGLDTQYIALSNKINPDMAKDFGLHEGNVAVYISRTGSVGAANTVVSQL